jgi:hypothetical protein
MKDFCEELPKHFKTWVQFWDEVVKLELHKTHETVKIFFNDEEREQEKEFDRTANRYSVDFIKERAFEELMQDRLERKEVLNFVYGAERVFYNYESTLLPTLSRVKRILLTQSYRK